MRANKSFFYLEKLNSLFVLLLWVGNILPAFSSSVVETYFPASQIKSSEWFQVEANGKPVFVYDNEQASFTMFDLEGKATLNIKSKKTVYHLDIRPKNIGLNYSFSGNNIVIEVTKPCQFSVEINKMPSKKPLLVFVNPIEKYKPSKNDTNVIYFEAGKVYTQGKIAVKSNQTVYVEGGAVVEGYIKAVNAENVKVIGRGILNGQYNRKFRAGTGDRFVEFLSCRNVTFSGLTLVNAVTWQVVPDMAENVLIDNIHIISEAASDDGIDIVRSKNVIIQNSFIRTKDDNIAIKCLKKGNPKATTSNVLVQNCVLWNTIWGNNIEIGFELAADSVSNLFFKNNEIIHCESGAAFSIHNSDFAVVNNVVFENITIEDVRQKFIDFSVFLSKYSVDNVFSTEVFYNGRYWHGLWDNAVLFINEQEKSDFAKGRGHISNVTLKNINITGGQDTFSAIIGYDATHKVKNVTFDNVIIRGKKVKRPQDINLITEFAEGIRFK